MSWIERAKVGDRVICVDGGFSSSKWTRVEEGKSYVIRNIGAFAHPVEGVIIGIWVEGIGRVCLDVDFPFHWRRFKPAKDTTLQVEAIKRAALNIPEHV